MGTFLPVFIPIHLLAFRATIVDVLASATLPGRVQLTQYTFAFLGAGQAVALVDLTLATGETWHAVIAPSILLVVMFRAPWTGARHAGQQRWPLALAGIEDVIVRLMRHTKQKQYVCPANKEERETDRERRIP